MSKYLTNIQNGIKEAGEKNVTIVGSTLVVEIVKRERLSAGGIYLGDKAEGKELTECIVIATGAGFYDPDTEEDQPLDTKVGSIVYVDPAHVRRLYAFPVANYTPHEIGMIEESQILLRFSGAEALSAFRKGAGLNE